MCDCIVDDPCRAWVHLYTSDTLMDVITIIIYILLY